MYAIVETLEHFEMCVTAAPKLWIEGFILFWPNSLVVDRKRPAVPDKRTWRQIKIINILKDCVGKEIVHL